MTEKNRIFTENVTGICFIAFIAIVFISIIVEVLFL